MIDIRNIENIEAYIDNNLQGKELEEFELLLEQDEDFADLVENIKAGVYAIDAIGHSEMKKKIKEIHRNMKQKRSTKIPVLFKIAAIFIGIASIAILSWYSFSAKHNYNSLFADNFEPYTNLLTIKGETQAFDEQSLINNAMYRYDLHDYMKANESFKKLLTYKKDNDTILFYYGISKLGAGEVDDAIVLLNKLLEKENSLFSRFGHVKWYLALAYLNDAGELQKAGKSEKEINDKLSKSKKLLNEIVAENGDFADDARKILKKIK